MSQTTNKRAPIFGSDWLMRKAASGGCPIGLDHASSRLARTTTAEIQALIDIAGVAPGCADDQFSAGRAETALIRTCSKVNAAMAKRGTTMSRVTLAAALLAATTALAGHASAAVVLGPGDAAVVLTAGNLKTGAFSLTSETFTVNTGGTLSATASGTSVLGSLVLSSFALLNSSNIVLASAGDLAPSPNDVFSSLGSVHIGPGSYTVRLTGGPVAAGALSAQVSFVPIPGAVLLLGSALAGLGAVGCRQRKTA